MIEQTGQFGKSNYLNCIAKMRILTAHANYISCWNNLEQCIWNSSLLLFSVEYGKNEWRCTTIGKVKHIPII